MANDILISPLGRSPGAISGMVFALNTLENVQITQVVTVGTHHDDVISSQAALNELFGPLGIGHQTYTIDEYDFSGARSAQQFVTHIGVAVTAAQDAGQPVHVAVTGGRAGMGALAALAASLYGADHLWHLWVPEVIARQGEIDKLPRPLPAAHPSINPVPAGQYAVIPLPFINLRPLHPKLWEAYHAGQLDDLAFPAGTLLAATHDEQMLEYFPAIFPPDMPMKRADRILDIQQKFGRLKKAERDRLFQELGMVLAQSPIGSPKEAQQLVQRAQLQMPPDFLLTAVPEQEDHTGFMVWLKEHQAEINEAIAVAGHVVSQPHVAELLVHKFNKPELDEICLMLNVPQNDLAHDSSVRNLARDLVEYMHRRNRLHELVAVCRIKRPREKWTYAGPDPNADPHTYVILPEHQVFLLHGLAFWLRYRGFGQDVV